MFRSSDKKLSDFGSNSGTLAHFCAEFLDRDKKPALFPSLWMKIMIRAENYQLVRLVENLLISINVCMHSGNNCYHDFLSRLNSFVQEMSTVIVGNQLKCQQFVSSSASRFGNSK